LMLGTNKSRGYCLEMICADFVAGADLENQGPDAITTSLRRLLAFVPQHQKDEFLAEMNSRK
jgi:hypothetical protein